MKRLLPLILLFLVSTSANADNLTTTKQTLDIINDFADKLCKTPPLEGGTKDTSLSVNAKAELNKVLKKVADLGVEGAAKYQSEQYKGLLQKDLANVLKDSSNCRLEVWRDLKDKLLPKKPEPLPPVKEKPLKLNNANEQQAPIEKLKQIEEHNRHLEEVARLNKAEAEAEAAVREFSVRNEVSLILTTNHKKTIAVLFRENVRAEEIDAYLELFKYDVGLVQTEKPGSLRRIRLILDMIAQVVADSNVGRAIQGKNQKERIRSIADLLKSSGLTDDQTVEDIRKHFLRYPSLTLR